MSTLKKYLGKIENLHFGIGGYQDCMMGISIRLRFDQTACISDYRGFWGPDLKPDKYTKWTEQDRDTRYAEVMRFIADLLHKSKKSNLNDLVGVPVEIEIEDRKLKSWRILEEVL